MIYYKRYTWYVALIVIALMAFPFLAVAKKTCLFISAQAPDERDLNLIVEVEKNYDVTIHASSDLVSGIIDIDYVKSFDFTFVAESINSGSAAKLKGAPIPLFTTELYISKWNLMGWVPFNIEYTYYGKTPEGENVALILDGSHYLAAGFEAGSEIEIVTGTINESYCIFSNPGIDYIQIAVLTADPSKTVVMGVEAGTVLYNNEDVMDGSEISENRAAAVGIHADANAFITEDAFKLINAGIQWILGDTATAVENKNYSLRPEEFWLDQNYPNPFNPSTTIDFTLIKPGHTILTVYNIMGQPVKKLVDGYMTSGKHSIVLNGDDLMSGVYFYKISSGEFMSMKKAILIK